MYLFLEILALRRLNRVWLFSNGSCTGNWSINCTGSPDSEVDQLHSTTFWWKGCEEEEDSTDSLTDLSASSFSESGPLFSAWDSGSSPVRFCSQSVHRQSREPWPHLHSWLSDEPPPHEVIPLNPLSDQRLLSVNHSWVISTSSPKKTTTTDVIHFATTTATLHWLSFFEKVCHLQAVCERVCNGNYGLTLWKETFLYDDEDDAQKEDTSAVDIICSKVRWLLCDNRSLEESQTSFLTEVCNRVLDTGIFLITMLRIFSRMCHSCRSDWGQLLHFKIRVCLIRFLSLFLLSLVKSLSFDVLLLLESLWRRSWCLLFLSLQTSTDDWRSSTQTILYSVSQTVKSLPFMLAFTAFTSTKTTHTIFWKCLETPLCFSWFVLRRDYLIVSSTATPLFSHSRHHLCFITSRTLPSSLFILRYSLFFLGSTSVIESLNLHLHLCISE